MAAFFYYFNIISKMISCNVMNQFLTKYLKPPYNPSDLYQTRDYSQYTLTPLHPFDPYQTRYNSQYTLTPMQPI